MTLGLTVHMVTHLFTLNKKLVFELSFLIYKDFPGCLTRVDHFSETLLINGNIEALAVLVKLGGS